MKLPSEIFPVLILLLAYSGNGDKVSQRDFRLPTTIQPSKYTLKLLVVLDPLPDYERFTANGEVIINVTCSEETKEIILHVGENLTIFQNSIGVSRSNGSNLKLNFLEYDTEIDFFIIHLEDSLQAGQNYSISMNFLSPIPDYRLNGMYQDYYIDPESLDKRYLATTLFAPYHARKLFPSFDEPSFRAEYDVSIGHHTKYHAMANELIVSSAPVEGIADYKWDIFATTPSISSYITAMIVSDFTFEEAPPTYFHNKTIRIYASPHLIAKGAGEYAANITDAVMAFLENRFQIMYPLDKLFSIALPHFFFSAMENIGMITYKEPVLLYLKNETTEEERYQINSVTNHELSHQWFGNIVACKWWAYVWLKEGFSTFYSHYGMNHTNPELEPWEMFIPKVLQVAMSFDASNGTHPLENFPPTSAAVADIYTSIPYQKGASILRMTSTFLTESVFEEAIKLYINRHQYQSAEQNDLFDALQDALDLNPNIHLHIPAPVREIMNSWCQQSKFPVIFASLNGTSLTLTQEEFSEDGPSTSATTTWWVPITVQPRSKPDLPGTVPDAWIAQDVSSISLEVRGGETVIVNPSAIGYYRVKYDDAMQFEIIKLLEKNHTKISSAARSKLIDDSFQLALSGFENTSYLPVEQAMEVTKYLDKEISTNVWTTVKETINTVLKLLDQINQNENAESLKEYILGKATAVWLTLQESDPSTLHGSKGILKELLSQWSCDLGSCFQLSEEEILQFIKNPDSRPEKEKQFSFYCSALEEDSDKCDNFVFGHLLGQYVNPNTLFGQKQRILRAFACTKDLSKLKWLANQIFSEDSEFFALGERVQLLKAMSKKQLAAGILLEKIHTNLKTVFDRFPDSVDDVLYEIVQNLDSHLKVVLDELERIDESKARLLHSRLATIAKRQALLKKAQHNLGRWLQENM